MKKLILIFIFLSFSTVCLAVDAWWVSQISMNPSNPKVGDTVTFTAQFKISHDNASNFDVAAGVDAGTQFNQFYPMMSQGTTQQVIFTWQATQGPHNVHFHLDPGGKLQDTNPGNNFIERFFEVSGGSGPGPGPQPGGKPNLTIIDAGILPQPLSKNTNAQIRAIVANVGDAPSPPTNALIHIKGNPIASVAVPGLNPQDKTIINANWLVDCGKMIVIHVDPAGMIAEHDEKDNIRSIPADCSIQADINDPGPNFPGGEPQHPKGGFESLPNFVVDNISWSPQEFFSGAEVSFQYVIKNVGPGTSQQMPTGTMTIGGVGPNSQQVQAPPAGGFAPGWSQLYKAKAYVFCENSQPILKITADEGNQIAETDEGDNSFSIKVPCKNIYNTEVIDLAIVGHGLKKCDFGFGTGYGYAMSTMNPNTCIIVHATVKNVGSKPSPAGVDLKLWLNLSVTGEVHTTIPVLNPGEENTYQVIAGVRCTEYSGDGHVFIWEIDNAQTLKEKTRNNNFGKTEWSCKE